MASYVSSIVPYDSMWLKKIMIIILILSGINLSAMERSELNQQLDSLESQLTFARGKERVDVLYQLTFLIAPYDQEKAEAYVEEESELVQKLNDELGRAKVSQNLGDIAYYRDNFIEALNDYNQALDIFKKHHFYLGLGNCYSRIVLIFYHTGNWEKGVEYLELAREAFESGDYYKDLATHYWGIGYFNNNYFEDYEKSKEVLNIAFHLAEEHHLSSAFHGGILASLGYAYSRNDEPDTAIIIYKRALSYLDDSILNDRGLRVQFLRELGTIYYQNGMPDSALYCLNLALDKAREMTYVFGVVYISLSMGSIYYHQGHYTDAINYYGQAIENALPVYKSGKGYVDEAYALAPVYAWDVHLPIMTHKAIRHYMLNYLITANLRISQSYEALNNFPESYKYFQAYRSWKDTINELNRQNELYGLQIGYDTERKDQQITLLEQENQLQQYRIRQNRAFLSGLWVLIIILSFISILFVRQRKLKADHQAVLIKQRLFRSQMNPHFIFNSLGSIQSSIINEEPDKAVKYLSRFSKLMRNILDSSVEETVSLEEELATIENYLELQKVRFDSKFDYTIDIDTDIDIENSYLPPMLAQPFIENSIEHGIKHKEGKGRIEIRCRRGNDVTIFEVEDDGVGRARAQEILMQQDAKHKSLATVITRERIAALNRRSRKKIKLEIVDLQDNDGNASGTRVVFRIPI